MIVVVVVVVVSAFFAGESVFGKLAEPPAL
jgi:hypothetical protein